MSPANPKAEYRVLPLPLVQRDAKKLLSARQLREAITVAKHLRHYPAIPELSIEHCGDGLELRLESPAINPRGWLRAIFWIHENSRTIYIVHLFWKKTNRVTVADIHLANSRIRQLKAQLR